MNSKINVGVVGCGQIAQIAHIPYLLELPQFELGAICDRSPMVLNSLGEKYKVRHRYTDYMDLVKQHDLDAVLVTNKNHAPVILSALNAGKHVFVEKPMAFNLKQADEIIAAISESKRVLMVGYMKRYDPGYQYAASLINKMHPIHLIRMHDFAGSYQINNEIYDLVSPTDLETTMIDAGLEQDANDMLVDIGEERRSKLKLFDILLHLCVHDINVIQGLFGIPERIRYASSYNDVFMTAVLEFKDGKHLVWESGNVLDLMDWDEKLWVYSEDCRLEIQFPFPYLKNAATLVNINEMEGGVSINKSILTSFDEAFKREWQHFYECVVDGRQPITNAQEAKADISFLVDIMKAAT